jgi:hypothetical protein
MAAAAAMISALTPIQPEDLVAGQIYSIRRRGIEIAVGEFTGNMRPGILGGDPIFLVNNDETVYPRARTSFLRLMGGGARRRRHRSRRASRGRRIFK